MSTLKTEINDSVYYINGEGLFIELKTDERRGYYDLKGVETLLVQAMKKGKPIDDLEDARAILRGYLHSISASNSEIAINEAMRRKQ